MFNCNTKGSQTGPMAAENRPVTILYQRERAAISVIKCITHTCPSRLSRDSFAAVSQWLWYFLYTTAFTIPPPPALFFWAQISNTVFLGQSSLYDLILLSPCLAPTWPPDKSKSCSGNNKKFCSLLKYLWKIFRCWKLFPSWLPFLK